MTSTRAKDFLTKELFIKKNVVTFRSLSRELGIHVNDAKNELAAYLAETANTDTASFATYLVSGQIAPLYSSRSLVDAMDYGDDMHQSVMRSKIVLVDSDGLRDAKAQFTRIHSVYIYSLSPSVFRDAGLICHPTVSVRDKDAKGNPAVNGKIIGVHVKTRKGLPKNASAASSSKTTLDARKPVVPQPSFFPRKSEQMTEKGKQNEGSKDKEHAKPLAATKEQPKPTGKLDWSKGKNKEQETASRAHVKEIVKPQPELDTKTSSYSAKLADKPSGNSNVGLQSMTKSISKVPAVKPMRATKRKSPDPSDSDVEVEDKPTPKNRKVIPSATSIARAQKGVIMSDDEDEEVPTKSRKKIVRTSDSERSLAAMMDIDDDQVVRVSRLSSHRPNDVVDDTGDEMDQTDVDAMISSLGEEEEEEEEDLKPQVKKRKSRKAVPVGHNGLKKRRVAKSRTTTDAKGYMQTEDYSSYESVSEEEAVPEDAKKKKFKKVVPVGSNGLKKHRVMKSRTITDTKGRKQTESYSSYESASEDEVVPVAVQKRKPKQVAPVRRIMKSRVITDAKGKKKTEDYSSYESISSDEAVEVVPEDVKKSKGKKKAESKLKDDAGDKSVPANSKIKETKSLRGTKARAGKGPQRGGLLNFFGPDKSKK
ncbi:DNA polymerase subunit Cdc27-domain-containing protein [Suillus clintonianus]|uniref:DNA polymerase subunit Cdc27-domain-containing protein n=1 Tax=Suillus clintonianus TaxID=1904413 RepID=UPI001B85C0F3|nr:DNA polymerase subunit Cdc27-domain-containing protein [Suillus clintonianus]KAG2125507.1 DNA polymerase subunit Cdc27-domain-containing protein [Suillus clintonianus]